MESVAAIVSSWWLQTVAIPAGVTNAAPEGIRNPACAGQKLSSGKIFVKV